MKKTNSTITMKESKISLGAGIGLLAGIIIGSATDNVGLWIALGLCFGAGIGTTLEKKIQWPKNEIIEEFDEDLPE